MEGPVIWPTWCYSGDASAVRETANNVERTMSGGRYRRKAHTHETTLVDIQHFATHYNADSMNNNNHSNNNNILKFERLSPGTTDTSSRSATPSSSLSNPNTPPADASALQLTCRNYSEFMRNLASKYQSTSSNDFLPLVLDSRVKATTTANFSPLFHPGGSGGGCAKDEPMRTPPMVLNPFSNAILPPLIDMSTTQVLYAMLRTAKDAELKGLLKHVKRAEACSPLDLSAGAPSPSKRTRTATPMCSPQPDGAQLAETHCQHALERADVFSWSVEEVCAFVASIDTCAEYVSKFKAEQIDGSSLPLLTEEHLTTAIQMKLGPALKLRATLAKRMCSCSICMHCIHCHNQIASSVAAATATESSAAQHAGSPTTLSNVDLQYEQS